MTFLLGLITGIAVVIVAQSLGRRAAMRQVPKCEICGSPTSFEFSTINVATDYRGEG